MKIIEKEFNALTGEETITEREETSEEKAEREAFEARVAAETTTKAETEAARQVLLDKLGINADEAALLLG